MPFPVRIIADGSELALLPLELIPFPFPELHFKAMWRTQISAIAVAKTSKVFLLVT